MANRVRWHHGAQESKTATIAASASLSGAIDTDGMLLVGIQMPSAWTAAGLSFQASYDGTTYTDVYGTGGTEVTYSTAASRFLQIPINTAIGGARFLKVRSGTAGIPVNQAAARDIQLIFRYS